MLLEKIQTLLASAKAANAPTIAYLSLLEAEMKVKVEAGETAEAVFESFKQTANELLVLAIQNSDNFKKNQAISNLNLLNSLS